MKPSFLTSMTSLIVFILALAVTLMGLWAFYKTGEVIDIFNTLVSAFVGAYLQRSTTNKEGQTITEQIKEVPAPIVDEGGV